MMSPLQVVCSTRVAKTREEVKMTPSKMLSDCRLDAKESFECMEKYDKATAKVITAAVIACIWMSARQNHFEIQIQYRVYNLLESDFIAGR